MRQQPTPDGDVEKLPKWAQRYVRQLVSRNEYLQGQLDQINSPAQTAVTWSVGIDAEHGIPERAVVTFKTDNGRIDVSLRDGVLRVLGSDGLMRVAPVSGNAIEVSLEGRWVRQSGAEDSQ